jgi:M6 family metalloprotease-like protein
VPLFAGDLGREARLCGSHFTPQYFHSLDDTGGRHITARGTLRVLLVFASFPDDETPHPFWSPHNPPLFMQQFIDPDTTTNSQASFNLTSYFYQMSLGQFHLVGDAIWLETAHSQEEYRNGAYGRANKNILQERVDSLVDFTRYDQWTKQADFRHANVPDGQVDMIIMVWRTNMFEFLGEASLGYKPGFVADGKRIEMGFPEYLPLPLGSGVTCQYLYTDSPYRVMQTMAHELGHWLLGGPHPYNGESLHDKHIYWGILCNGLRAASCANAYEREKLGWITVPEIRPDLNIPLPDYLRTGVAYKYHPGNGGPVEYFYIENHQKLSTFDDVTVNPEDKGIWILHQQGPYMELDNLRIRPSDGNWNWENPGTTTSCFSQPLPVFKKGVPKMRTGESHRDQIPNRASAVNWLLAYKDPASQLHCGVFYKGQMFIGAFSVNSSRLFSQYSNPQSNTWENQQTPFSLEIVNELNGVVTVRYNSNPLDAAPARRYLGLDPTAQGTPPGSVSLAWGAQWTEGQPLEADVNLSELQRQIGNEGNWNTVYQGTTTSWRDGSILYDTNGTVPVLFRVKVRDTQGKYSAWSNVFYTAMVAVNGVDNQTGEIDEMLVHYELGGNYPNPFNSSTSVEFHLPHTESVTLKVYNLLGAEVQTVFLNEKMSAGIHKVSVKMENLPSGIYLYKLKTNRFEQTKKMLLLK